MLYRCPCFRQRRPFWYSEGFYSRCLSIFNNVPSLHVVFSGGIYPPLWDYILGLTDENAFVLYIMTPTCCQDSGGGAKIRSVLMEADGDREQCMRELLSVMKAARHAYLKKGVPLNTEFMVLKFR